MGSGTGLLAACVVFAALAVISVIGYPRFVATLRAKAATSRPR
jgi:hypothetical protein